MKLFLHFSLFDIRICGKRICPERKKKKRLNKKKNDKKIVKKLTQKNLEFLRENSNHNWDFGISIFTPKILKLENCNFCVKIQMRHFGQFFTKTYF